MKANCWMGKREMQVQDVDALLVNEAKHGRQREGIELAALQIGDVDTEAVEGFFRKILFAEAEQRHVEPIAVEARNHPTE